MKILFFGSSNYCFPILETLHKNFTLVGVVTKPSSPSQSFAHSRQIPVFTPKNRTELLMVQNELMKLQPDVAVVADFGLIIPPEIFTIPKKKTLNIHFSKLPKLRGATPVQFTLLLGAKSAWITIIVMDETMDTGDIIWQKEVLQLKGDETTSDLYRKLFSIAANELPGVIDKFLLKKLRRLKQLDSQATYTRILTREDGFIPAQLLEKALKGIKTPGRWPTCPPKPCHRRAIAALATERRRRKDSFQVEESKQTLICKLSQSDQSVQLPILIECAVRALYPWPGVWTKITFRAIPSINQKRLKILKAHLELITYHSQPTTKLVLDLVQLEGKNPVSWKQFAQGYLHFSFT